MSNVGRIYKKLRELHESYMPTISVGSILKECINIPIKNHISNNESGMDLYSLILLRLRLMHHKATMPKVNINNLL